jgi:hypothetical protein
VTKRTRPDKLQNLLEKIKESIVKRTYILTIHAVKRQNERMITLPEVLYVLKTGFEEKKKTCFDEVHHSWKYAIRGTTLRGADTRIVVAFDDENMLIITVIHIKRSL